MSVFPLIPGSLSNQDLNLFTQISPYLLKCMQELDTSIHELQKHGDWQGDKYPQAFGSTELGIAKLSKTSVVLNASHVVASAFPCSSG